MDEREGERARASCRRCGAPFTLEPAAAGVCPACRDDAYPPISYRAGKWSPLALGGFSLVCDVMMIPSIMAIVRGTRELREVTRREGEGFWSDEHPKVRAGAVWGMVLGAARPMAMVLLFAAVALGVATRHRNQPAPVRGPSELDEVLERIVSDDDATRAMAMEHLAATGPAFSELEVERLLALAERHLEDPAAHATEVSSRLVAAAMLSELQAPPPGYGARRLHRVVALYPSLDANARTAVLRFLATRGTADALSRLGEVAASDDGLDPAPSLPMAELARHGQHADRFLRALLRTDVHRQAAISLAALFCERGAQVEHSRDALLTHWARLGSRPSPGRGWDRLRAEPTARSREAVDTLNALRCLGGEDVDEILRAASGDEDPRMAVAAVDALFQRGERVPIRVLARLAADPLSRRAAIEAAVHHGVIHRIPARSRDLEAVAEADAVRWFADDDRAVRSLAVVATRAPARDERYAAVRVELGDGSATSLVLGPYPANAWARAAEDVDGTAFVADLAGGDDGMLVDLVREERRLGVRGDR